MWWMLAGLGLGTAYAQAPDDLAVALRVIDSSGDPLEGSIDVDVALRSTADPASTLLWSDGPLTTTAQRGLVDLTLANVTPAQVPSTGAWLHVSAVGGAFDPIAVPLHTAPYALTAASAPWTGLTGVPADLADGDQDRPTHDVAHNWDFEDGPVGDDIAGFLPGWLVSGDLAGMDHTTVVGRDGLGFGADSCCTPPVGRWSLFKYFAGNFDGRTVTVSVDTRGATTDNGSCGAGQEFIGEDDGRFYLRAYDAAGSTLGTAYSKRASWWKANGGLQPDGWTTVTFDWSPPAGTRLVRVEIYSDDQNDQCAAEGSRGTGGNASIYYDNFSFSTDGDNDAWSEYAQPLTLPAGLP